MTLRRLLAGVCIALGTCHAEATILPPSAGAAQSAGGLPAFAANFQPLGRGVKKLGAKCPRHAVLELAPVKSLVVRRGELGGLSMSTVDGPQPNSGGDDETELWGHGPAGRAQPAQSWEVPGEVSSRVLQFYMLQQSMRHAVREERYVEASRLPDGMPH